MSDDRAEQIDRLKAVRDSLRRTGDPQSEWFSACLARFINKQSRCLDDAFETAAPKSGARTALDEYLLRERNEALCRAFDHVEGSTPASRVKELRRRVETIAALWDELGQLDKPDPSWSMLKREIWWACRYADLSGRKVPGTKHLGTIVIEPGAHDLDEVTGESIEPWAPR